GGVRVAVGDVTGDSVPDVVTAPGPGMPAVIEVFDGATGGLVRATTAFEPSFVGGCFVSAGDVDRDGIADVVVSPDTSGGPRVRVLSGRSGGPLADFFAIADPNFRGGVRTTLGDL